MTRGILRIAFFIALAMALASCASTTDLSAGSSSSYFSVNGLSYHSMDLRNPHFYMDDDQQMAPIARDPRCC
jgi:hypothetical protein